MNNKRELLEAYKGSAKNYIRKYIIPSLPQKDNIINFTSSIYNYLEGSKVRYIRKLKNYSSRGKIYNDGSLSFTVTDNEPALWAYMECLEQSVNSFEHYHATLLFQLLSLLEAKKKKSLIQSFVMEKKREKLISLKPA